MLQAQTGIEGHISLSPAHGGPVRVGEQGSRPMANATFVATNQTGTSTEFTTDDHGWFKISLAPGHYTVTRKGPQKGIGHYGPFDIEVVAGQTTRVDWRCDSGMR